MEAHGEDLHAQVDDADLVDAVKSDFRSAPLKDADRAMLEFAAKLTRIPAKMAPGDLDALRSHGFSDEALLEIVHITGFFNYINRVADALGVDPEPEWSRSASND